MAKKSYQDILTGRDSGKHWSVPGVSRHLGTVPDVHLQGLHGDMVGALLWRSRMKDHGSRIKDQGSRIKDHGSRIKDQGSTIQDQGSWTLFWHG